MEIKQDFSKAHVILCHDDYEFTIRCLKRAVDILESEQEEDRYEKDSTPVYPLNRAISALKDKIWKVFDEMCGQKADYDSDEWLKMKGEHRKRAEEQKHLQK